MKKAVLFLAVSVMAGFSTFPLQAKGTDPKKVKQEVRKEEEQTYIKAIRLVNTEDGKCTFEVGKIPTKMRMETTSFFGQTKVDAYEKVAHPAPRRQYVVTIKGKLKFKVSNGDTFIIEPGVILIAEDTKGTGHTWDLVDGDKWERLYIPLNEGGEDHFIPEKSKK